MDCIFCQIAAGKVPSDILYRDDDVVAFRDIHPQSPIHLLIIPKKHIASVIDLSEADLHLIGHMVNVANQLARKEGVAEKGYRLVINYGEHGGQVVQHLHLHLLGGRRLAGGMG
ncbi:histidine triad nucleotide-binding protein [Chloroflexota bacterium]